MTTGNKTYDQLYWDLEFIQKRIEEQYQYMENLQERYENGEIHTIRANAMNDSASDVLHRLKNQLRNIQKLK